MSTQSFYANVDREMDQTEECIVIGDDDDDYDSADGKTVSFIFCRIFC